MSACETVSTEADPLLHNGLLLAAHCRHCRMGQKSDAAGVAQVVVYCTGHIPDAAFCMVAVSEVCLNLPEAQSASSHHQGTLSRKHLKRKAIQQEQKAEKTLRTKKEKSLHEQKKVVDATVEPCRRPRSLRYAACIDRRIRGNATHPSQRSTVCSSDIGWVGIQLVEWMRRMESRV